MVRYDLMPQAYPRYAALLDELTAQESVTKICDVGGGARPSLSPEETRTRNIEYHVLDISADELEKAPDCFAKVQADICAPSLPVSETYDVVTSKFVAEHVSDGYRFHRNIHDLLVEGGYALHLFPTLYALPFLINFLTPEKLSVELLDFFSPQARKKRAKFPTRYSWCRGPTRRQIRRFENLGYEIVEYTGFFGTPYLDRLKPLKKVDRRLSAKLVTRPIPWLTSYACLLLHKA